MYSSVYLELR